MNLVIDSGNTRIKTGLFDGRKLKASKIFGSQQTELIKNFIASEKPERLLISDVSGKLNAKKFKAENILFLTEKTPMPIRIRYSPLKNLGKDRICNAVAADSLFPNSTILIIDCGTALKIDLVEKKVFKGGSIAPGMKMRFESLHRFTASLPLIKPDQEFGIAGNSTRESILSGVLFGMLSEMENRIRIYRKELTGGDWPWFVNHLKYPIFAAPELTLIGLNEILLFQK